MIDYYNMYVNDCLTNWCIFEDIPGEILAVLGFKPELAFSYSVCEEAQEMNITVEVAPGIHVNVQVWLKDVDQLLMR